MTRKRTTSKTPESDGVRSVRPGTTIDKHPQRVRFAGPSSFRETGGFAGNGFKDGDKSR